MSLKVLLLEDEKAAARRLQQMLEQLRPGLQVLAVCETVQETLEWLRDHPAPELVISDIQLADGTSFEVFARAQLKVPVIFITAYDTYMLQAFKVNSIDYILKPVDKEELQAALDKYDTFHRANILDVRLIHMLQQLPRTGQVYRSRFLIRQGDRLFTVNTDVVRYLRADDKIVLLHTTGPGKYIVDETMEELEQSLDPALFFRLNRSYIAHVDAIRQIHAHFNGRLKIQLADCSDTDIFVSRQRSQEFKRWLNR